jgi:3-deoxy-7-phosphoheptulonate synthase
MSASQSSSAQSSLAAAKPALKLFKAHESSQSAAVQSLVYNPRHPRRVIEVIPGVEIGANRIAVIAGPCSIESEEQFYKVAQFVREHSASLVRAGAFKPRTSPYTFQGLGREGLEFARVLKERLKIPIVSEITDIRLLAEMHDIVDVFQVGARNMYNYPLLRELGMITKPVLLKRSMMATIEEFCGAAEHITSRGNQNVILCERGIRSFDSNTRFCLDLNSIPVLQERTDLPIIVDPSHGTGVSRYVEAMSLAAIAAGADGLLIEVHHDPENALSDGKQSLDFVQFESLALKARVIAHALGRTI